MLAVGIRVRVNSCFHHYILKLITVPSLRDTAPLSSVLLCLLPPIKVQAELEMRLRSRISYRTIQNGLEGEANSGLFIPVFGDRGDLVRMSNIFLAGNTYLASFHNA